MLFMVIETFRGGGWREVGERFRAGAPMIPANAVVEHVAGSMTPGGGAPRGFMADRRARVGFEVVEAQEPAAFLAGRAVRASSGSRRPPGEIVRPRLPIRF